MVGETVGDQIGEEPAAVDLSFAVFSDCGGEVASRVRYGDEIRIVWIVGRRAATHPKSCWQGACTGRLELFVEIALVLGHGLAMLANACAASSRAK
jgi:hypothetical protein